MVTESTSSKSEAGLGITSNSSHIVTISGLDVTQPMMLCIYVGSNQTTRPNLNVTSITSIKTINLGSGVEGTALDIIIGNPVSSSIQVSSDVVFNNGTSFDVTAYQVSI